MPPNKENILIIKLGALGDFIQALGPMQAIRSHHPDAKITLLTTKPFEALVQKSGHCDEIWIDEKPRFFEFSKWRSLKKQFNEGQFLRVYDLQNNDRTSFYFKLFNPKPEWSGVAKGASHRNNSKERTAGQAFDGHKMTLKVAGIDDVKIDTLEWIQADLSNFNLRGKYALIIAGSAPQHPYKRWPAIRYGKICKELCNQGIQSVLLGTDAEREITAQIKQACPDCLDLTGQTSLDQIAVLSRSALFALGNDTGPMHLIAPTGCPTIVLFSKYSNPVRHAPKGPCVKTLKVDDLNDLSIPMVSAAISEYLPKQ
ncbi:MAG: glycosyltransferase family 9 protein [Alphaproteobacteria bacterium]|nr:glycosyltransferase family 9 protein [Alphaproteobacteria bacterium]